MRCSAGRRILGSAALLALFAAWPSPSWPEAQPPLPVPRPQPAADPKPTRPDQPQQKPADASSDCVTTPRPRPNVTYTFRFTNANGSATTTTMRWLETTDGSVRVRTTQSDVPGVTESMSQITQHIRDDLFVIEKSDSTNVTTGRGPVRTVATYKPALIGDPAFHLCKGKKWSFPAVTMTTVVDPGKTSQTTTYAGNGEVLSVHESVTVPAGAFDTVHYMVTHTSPNGPITLESWRSIKEGVNAKYTYTVNRATATQVLISIR
jgi:hypothetical protein